MTTPFTTRRQLLLVVAVVVGLTGGTIAQTTSVTPSQTVTPSGTTTVINDGAGDQGDPHISGSLVSYTSDVRANADIRFHNLADGSDAVVPNSGEHDFLSDVSGSRVVFARVSTDISIFLFDTAGSDAPLELAPSATANRRSSAIGNLTVAYLRTA